MITTCNDGPVETAHDAYQRMLRDELAPRLQALGLTAALSTTGEQYQLDTPGHYALLGPHAYWANTPTSFQFTINVLVVSHTDWDTYRTTHPDTGEHPDAGTHYGRGGPWIERLGTLMGMGDKWWYVSPRRDTQPIAEEVAFSVSQWAIPEMLRRT